jgi:uncharacterized iron-regulated membrane protein
MPARSLLRDFLTTPRAVPLRRLLFAVHLWIGVAIALYVALVGLTGAVLVFKVELDRLEHPELYPVAPTAARAPILDVLAGVREAYPDGRVASIYDPRPGVPVFHAFVEQAGQTRMVLAAADSGVVLGQRPESGIVRWVQLLHTNLLGGVPGRRVNGVGALLLLGMCVTGPLLWWPGLGSWRRALMVSVKGNWKRVTWESHNAVGVWTFAVLGLWAVTGIYFAFPGTVSSLVYRLAPPIGSTASPMSTVETPGPRPDLADVVATARRTVPGSEVAGLVLPRSDRDAIVVEMAHPTAARPNGEPAYVRLAFDQGTGELVEQRDGSRQSAGDTALAWALPLHAGTFGGWPVRVLWSVLGVAPVLLAASGMVMWWNRSLRRRGAPPA